MRFLDKLTDADPQERFASAKDALSALENRDAIFVAPTNAKKPPRKRRRVWPLAVVAAGALVAGGGVAAFHALTPEEVPDPGYVHVIAGPQDEFTVSVDGEMWGNASHDTTIRLNPGVHKIKLVGERGETCSDQVRVRSGLTETLECPLPQSRVPVGLQIGQASRTVTPPLDLPTEVTLSTSAPTDVDDVLLHLADSCSVNIVSRAGIGHGVPPPRRDSSDPHIAPGVVMKADKVRCDEAITALLESRGLGFVYSPDAHLIRIGRREELFASAAPDQFKGQLRRGTGYL